MLQNIKSVLIGMTEEGIDEPSAALAYGISLAEKSGAHATIQAASLKVVLGSTLVNSMGANLVAAHNRRLRELAAAVGERARGDAAAAGVAASVETPQLAYGQLVEVFVAQAMVHDIAIVDSETATVNADRGLIEALLFESGRPVMVIPEHCDTFKGKRIVVAWDASPRAARAVNDAMSFLKAAEAVEVLAVGSEKELSKSIPGAELAPHLARHGVNVTVKNLVSQGSIAATIADQLDLFGADMLVMGAFNHSLMREWVLGGVTESMLKETKVPLFLSY
ncbi:universal stress protein [Xanthobacter tagetidis]|jgi:nucleotide-binding universal stress UspA family protein|uniref:Universal stress protein n=1 Tax=Xanthobacter tagetidis TaxID=60216 RepID=A0A3L7A934_9HYPH|nr:universal stress protein [Xanthobacter tagetidis]MBB6309393.1 nucleotide-binding universal stress UspA family protein [Xanthobacter tagetidis]RLP76697.1 universal stress protein [Xanthobacter tagetidis]